MVSFVRVIDSLGRKQMRAAGLQSLKDQTRINQQSTPSWDMPGLREQQEREGNRRWRENRHAGIKAGIIKNEPHPGDVDFDNLPPDQRHNIKLQVWADWRTCAKFNDSQWEYLLAIKANGINV